MAEAAKDERAKRARAHVPVSDGPDPAGSDGPHVQGGCPVAWCPICMAVTAVQPHYAVGSGEARLDLGQLSLKPGTTIRTR